MNRSMNRKIGYVLAILALYCVLLVLGKGIESSASQHRLEQKSLGNVNPVSGTAQLVLAGFRGVAVTFLWYEANELKKKERWFEIRPVVESISLLQPNFVRPWQFQSWNMAYNIAAEWEAVADKYYWIRQGIDFMKKGVETNRDLPDMDWYVGFMYFNKFGISDEKVYLRELLRKEPDTSFALSKSGLQDNFEISYDWFEQANEIIRRTQKRPKGMSITPFMYKSGMAKMYYASTLADEGNFDEKTKDGWRAAYREWIKLGREGGPDREIDLIHRLEFSDSEVKDLTEDQLYWIDRYKNVVRYDYWKQRAKVEATDEMQRAREGFYVARASLRAGDYQKSIEEYERAFPRWRTILEEDIMMREDDEMRDECQEQEARYLRLLSRLDFPVPEKRPFEGLYEELPPPPPISGRDLERFGTEGNFNPAQVNEGAVP